MLVHSRNFRIARQFDMRSIRIPWAAKLPILKYSEECCVLINEGSLLKVEKGETTPHHWDTQFVPYGTINKAE